MVRLCFFFFFFNDTATTEIYTLSLHDALPICEAVPRRANGAGHRPRAVVLGRRPPERRRAGAYTRWAGAARRHRARRGASRPGARAGRAGRRGPRGGGGLDCARPVVPTLKGGLGDALAC